MIDLILGTVAAVWHVAVQTVDRCTNSNVPKNLPFQYK